MPVYMLLDNGSKRAEASLQLRRLAQALSQKNGVAIHPVSLQHADAIAPQSLGGPAGLDPGRLPAPPL